MSPPEPLEQYAVPIVEKLISLVRIENEDNAILCIKIVMDMQRNQSKALANHVQPYLDLIQEMFENVDQIVKDTFSAPNQSGQSSGPASAATSQVAGSSRPGSPAVKPPSDIDAEPPQTRLLPKGTQSFKVLAECPIAVVSIFQAYRDIVHPNVKKFVPLIKRVLTAQCPAQEKAHEEAKAKDTVLIGISKDVKNRAGFNDLVTAQVKTMSFLAYLLRVYGQLLSGFLEQVPFMIVRLLKDIPKDKCSVRRELIVAVRHIVNFNFRRVFKPVIDDLLDERILLGDSLTVHESLKPIAYSTVADLIHHIRDTLSVDQIRRTIKLFKKNLLSDMPGTSYQTMSAKLLMNIGEAITRLENKQEVRYFLIAVLDATAEKFAAMNRQYHNAKKISANFDHEASEVSSADFVANKDDPPDWDDVDIFNTASIKTNNPRERSLDPVSDNKFLFKNLVMGLKGLFYQLRTCNPPAVVDPNIAPLNWGEVAYGFSAEEVDVLIKLFHEGTSMFQYYEGERPPSETHMTPAELLAGHHQVCGKEEKDLLDSFATVFHHIDPATFHEIFQSEIPHIYHKMYDHPGLLQIPQFLLASEVTSPSFAGMMLQFLMTQLEDVGSSDVDKATILLRLFKLSFMAVTLFSQQNEAVLLPHVNKLITSSLQLSTTAESPMQYFYLLRSLFRSIGGGRFEHLYHEILPLLEMLLEVLNNLIASARNTHDQDLFVELSLTVPARLSNLLPHLSYLMRPLVLALRAGSDLVSQGLRTLELCVDNLTADYLDPIMAPVIDTLMTALWEHLKPSPYNHFHAHTTMRILGKLGGRNRKFLDGPPILKYELHADGISTFDYRLIGSTTTSKFPATIGVELAMEKIRQPSAPGKKITKEMHAFHVQQGFKFIVAQVKLLLGSDSLSSDFLNQVRIRANDITEGNADGVSSPPMPKAKEQSPLKKDEQQRTLGDLLKSCLYATSVPELADEARPFLHDLYRHFAILEIGQAAIDLKLEHDKDTFNVEGGEGVLEINHRVVIPAIVDSLSSERIEVRETAQEAMSSIYDACAIIFGSKTPVIKLPFWTSLLNNCCHSCYKDEWFAKSGGALGINLMATKLDIDSSWFVDKQVDICKALMYAAKDLPDDLPQSTRLQALDTLKIIIRQCNAQCTREEILSSTSKAHGLCAFLVSELSHSCRHVREVTQSALSILSEISETPVHELMAPVKNGLLSTIFNKPLRALPFAIQIGYIDAITYCMRLQNDILEPNESMGRFLRETSFLAEQDQENFLGRPPDQRHLENVTKLRVSCLRLLSSVLDFPKFNESPTGKNRPKIITSFFKAIYSKQKDVIEAANTALRNVVERDTKLPKDILQQGLRPILMSLQDVSRLKIDSLHCLSRLLKILKTYFKVEIGARLLDSSYQIVSEETLQKASFKLIEQHENINVLSAVLGIFHLLPAPGAEMFMNRLVDKIIELEKALRRTRFSPFREPLIQYFNRYAIKAWEKINSCLTTDRHRGCFYAQLLADERSKPVRDAIGRNLKPLLDVCTAQADSSQSQVTATINVVHISNALCKYPEVGKQLVSNAPFRKALLERGKALEELLQKNDIEPSSRLMAEQTSFNLVGIFVFYLTEFSDDTETLFELIESVTAEKLKEIPEIFTFIYKHLISSENVEQRRKVIMKAIEIYNSKQHAEIYKAWLLRNLVSPILAKDVMKNWNVLFEQGKEGTELVDRLLMETFAVKLWRPQANIDPLDDYPPANIDHSQIELLQLTALLLKYYSNAIFSLRKDCIRCGWNYIRLEDTINKYAAYVALSYFVATFETPPKISIQIYGTLISAHFGEARSLVAQALEILAPVIPLRMVPPPAEGKATKELKESKDRDESMEPKDTKEAKMAKEPKVPLWTLYARRPLLEDPSNLQQMISIFQFVSRHGDLFYEARESFAQIIIPSLHKVAQIPNQSMESRKLATSLFQLLWGWEYRHHAESSRAPASSAGSMTPVGETSDTPTRSKSKSFIPSSLRAMFLKYLTQFIASLPDRCMSSSSRLKEQSASQAAHAIQGQTICRKSLEVFANFLSAPYWDDLDIEPMYPKVTESVLCSEPKMDDKLELAITRIVNTLQLVNVMLNVKPDEWVQGRLPQLQKLLDKPLKSVHADVQEALFSKSEQETESRTPPICRILEVVPKESAADDEMSDSGEQNPDFVTFLNNLVKELLDGSNLHAGVNVLGAFATSRPQEIDQHIPRVMQIFLTSVEEHVKAIDMFARKMQQASHGQRSGSDAAAASGQIMNPNVLESQDKLILKIIELLASRIAQLGDSRRSYLQQLITLIERSPKAQICSKIVDLVSSWLFDTTTVFPTLKEKNSVVIKMTSFEGRQDQGLFEKFLDIVIRVYEDPTITRSELAIRLEPAFLIGTRAPNIEMRNRYMTLFDRHLSRTAGRRLVYLLHDQSWEALQSSFWLSQIIQLLFGSIESNAPVSLGLTDFTTVKASKLFGGGSSQNDLMLDEKYEQLMSSHQQFVSQLREVRAINIFEPLCHLQYAESKLAVDVWSALFPAFWAILSKEERDDINRGLISLTTKEYHSRQLDKRPNCIQALMEGIARCDNPRMNFPHNLIKYLAKTYDAWYSSMCTLEQSVFDPIVNTAVVRESTMDALAEVYAQLSEDDLFYGLWRRRAQFLTTNTALSYEQIGHWERAQRTFESATFKARTAEIPFQQSEYMLWEDHWVICAEKLQQWDILGEFAKVDNLNDLYLDAVWRQFDKWQAPDQLRHMDAVIKSVSDSPTPRRMFFQSFLTLLKTYQNQESPSSFSRVIDEAVQLSIRKWHQLPDRITNAHIPLLQSFQQLVEMHDAGVICTSLNTTNQGNLEHKAPELKLLLGTWRDRLPNFWDDIDSWHDLVTWRRHIFQLVNEKYLTLLPQQPNGQGNNSFAYRGFHETAWTINKFAHVARKHQLPDVCVAQLSTIYTLPNIEIQEAFLKLREQAKCHYQNPNDLQTGLDVINNTNLSYFGPQQKAEFYTLKGMFLAKQSKLAEADEAFSNALQYDLKLPKGWAEWAKYQESIFKQNPSDISKAEGALRCHLEAAGTYKNAKSRKAIGRVLWLLSLDNAEGKIAKTFEEYKGDVPVWYWITFIPQLINSISRPEAAIAKSILVKIARQYPQALYYPLRTSKEDFAQIKKQHEAREAKAKGANPAQSSQAHSGSPESRPQTADNSAENASRPGTAAGDSQKGSTGDQSAVKKEEGEGKSQDVTMTDAPLENSEQDEKKAESAPQKPLQPWDYLDDIHAVLKTAFPLLAMSMETIVDQIAKNFKSGPDEDAYRLISALLSDALSYVSHSPNRFSKGTRLPMATEANITRFAESVLPAHIYKVFAADFLHESPDIPDYIRKVRKWRDRFEEKLDRRPQFCNLETIGPHLSEFKFNKFDEVEIPGQYLLHRDKNQDFVRIERFLPDVELVRSIGQCHKRLKIRGHDGSTHVFMVQHPAPRNARREERAVQMFRFFNDILAKRKESRRRKIQFTLPPVVPLTPSLRIIADDPSYITLQGIYEEYCRRKGMGRDDPVLFTINKLRELQPRSAENANAIRAQIHDTISRNMVPGSIVLDYFRATFPAFADFWLFRRQAAYQMAALSFLNYILMMRDRNPTKMHFSRGTGSIWGSDLVPNMSSTGGANPRPIFGNNEAVQIRYTPNLQMLMGPVAIEGVFSASIGVVARSLVDPMSVEDEMVAEKTRPGSQNGANNAGALTNGTASTAGANTAQPSSSSAPPPSSPVRDTSSSSSTTLHPDTPLESILSIFIRDEIILWSTANKRPAPNRDELREFVQNNGDMVLKRAQVLAKAPGGDLPANQSVIDLIGKCGDPKRLCQMELGWMSYL